LVNQSLAKQLWPHEDPIGKQVRALVDPRGALFTVVGVVGDARDWRWPAASQIEMYVPFAQRPSTYMYAVVRSSAPLATITSDIRRLVHTTDPNIPVRISTLSSNINETMADRRFFAGVLLAFSVAVLALTVIGVFGAVSYAVAMRTREIGIRLAVGATPGGIWLGVQQRMFTIVAAGGVAGLCVAWVASRALKALLYGIATHDVASFALALGLVCVAGTLAAAWPARRAARVDPAMSLRAES
jgi:ABC-type antimicrobial peptide transport system permease subunit